jgi:hypothetical protein
MTDTLHDALETVAEVLREEWGGLIQVEVGGWMLGLDYGVDPEYGEYAILGFNLPHPWFGEIDDGTFGSLQGFRVYRNDLLDSSVTVG